jgi:HTH-type transcriptional regulator, competence development regulator
MEQSSSFGEVLRAVRREAGVSQRSLAEGVGVDFSYISKLENGHLPSPAADTIIKMCEVLGVPSEKLLSLSGKLPTDVQETMGGSPAAQLFMRDAQQLGITETEWKNLREQMRRLREE